MDSDIDVSFGPKLQKDSLNSDKSLAMRGYCSLEVGSLMSPPCQNQPTRPSDIDAGKYIAVDMWINGQNSGYNMS